jgi:hypothetical protein
MTAGAWSTRRAGRSVSRSAADFGSSRRKSCARSHPFRARGLSSSPPSRGDDRVFAGRFLLTSAAGAHGQSGGVVAPSPPRREILFRRWRRCRSGSHPPGGQTENGLVRRVPSRAKRSARHLRRPRRSNAAGRSIAGPPRHIGGMMNCNCVLMMGGAFLRRGWRIFRHLPKTKIATDSLFIDPEFPGYSMV